MGAMDQELKKSKDLKGKKHRCQFSNKAGKSGEKKQNDGKYRKGKENIMKVTALILAGGKGERFWPRSRKSSPKQFLCLTGDGETMIQKTVNRIRPLVEFEDIFIATNQDYKTLIRQQLPEIPEENILCEPVGRNTAPCIGLGAVHIRKKYEDAVMLVLPSDHLIKYNDQFVGLLKDAVKVAEEGRNLVTIGILPNVPETGYGYIKYNKEMKLRDSYKVDRFVEKPNLEKAKEYLSSGDYLWNSGMFLWKASSILNSMETYLPDIYKGLTEIEESIGCEKEEEVLRSSFTAMPSESVDYGILEKEDSIYVFPGTFGWDDVGSWLAVERMKPVTDEGNVIAGNVVTYQVENCIVEGSEKLIAAVGLKNLVVVDTEDATLICSKEHTADIKKILEELRNQNQEKYL